MSKSKVIAALTALLACLQAPSANACGGFFCGRQPVDQTAERILFEVDEDSVTMTTQIAYNGDAENFAWILPLPEVPDADSLAVFPQLALTGLDANSGPLFYQPDDPECYPLTDTPDLGVAVNSASEGPEVTVYIEAEVGDYQVAVIESEDPAALIDWLRTEDYRVTPAMEPYIELYTAEGMKFLALKLLDTADVQNLKPFRFTLPGTTPTIPLRMTALAAEPEMSIVVFVVGDSRYEGKNWENLQIADDQIKFNPFSYTWPIQTNWAKLVAEVINDAGGQGWVTEFAGSTESYAEQVRNQVQSGSFGSPEQEEAAVALLDVLDAHPYITRLYARLSAEEMTSDPVFGRSNEGDVSREHQLSRYVNGVDQCSSENMIEPSVEPCDFATCGAGGLCVPVAAEAALSSTTDVAGCACVPGATARTTFAPDGTPTVICQDERMSFLNPGDQEIPEAEALGDPCATFDCGGNGSCVPVNMTPTCVCDPGFVAVGSFAADGSRVTTCVEPSEPVPSSFYEERLPDLPELLPGGREVDVPEPEVDPNATGQDPMSGEEAAGGQAQLGSDPTASGEDPTSQAPGLEDPTGVDDSSTSGDADTDSGCSIAAGPRHNAALALALGLAALALTRRRRQLTS